MFAKNLLQNIPEILTPIFQVAVKFFTASDQRFSASTDTYHFIEGYTKAMG